LCDKVKNNSYNIAASKTKKKLIMKRVKKDATTFKKMNALQMVKIKGGVWIEVTNPDGTISKVEV